MTSSAWIMMLTSWSVILFFTFKFFIKVFKTPK